MLNKIFVLVLFLFLSSCGYEAIHSKKNLINYNFSISELNFTGDRNVNLKMKEKLNIYTLTKKDKNFILEISSTAKKIVLAKNATGDSTNFKKTILINVEVLRKDNLVTNFQITENFNYNNITNKFELARYEREIIDNLTETAKDKIIFRLSNIQ
tara:strand:- start:895 stop:1359 length:465 start_codon:yes stop_codon:yes gene_type:complete